MTSVFPSGVVIFFRALDGNVLARSVHPDGRDVEINSESAHPDDYVVLDGDKKLLGVYPREWVACILPLQTQGPASASNQQDRPDNSAPAETGNSQSVTRRVKRIHS